MQPPRSALTGCQHVTLKEVVAELVPGRMTGRLCLVLACEVQAFDDMILHCLYCCIASRVRL